MCVIPGMNSADLVGRFAIDPTTDFSSARAQVAALAGAAPGDKSRLSTTISVRTEGAKASKGDKADKDTGKKKEKRRESGGGDAKRSKKPKTKA